MRLLFSGSRFNFPIISDIPTYPFYCFIIIVTKTRCTSLDLFFIYEYLGVVVPHG